MRAVGCSVDMHVGLLHDFAQACQFGSKFPGVRLAAALVGREQLSAEFRQTGVDSRVRARPARPASATCSAAFSLSRISIGVPFGAYSPCHTVTSTCGNPISAVVGM